MTMLTRRTMLGGAAAITAAGALNATPVHAAAPMIGKQGPSFYRYKVGDFEVTALNEGVVRNATPQNMAVNKTLPDVQKALGEAFLPTDHVINQFNVLVVNTGRNLVLLDSGFGDNGAPTVGNLVNNMNAAGIDPKNIDTILVSHFHGDHISGIRAKAGAANFPNAEIVVPSGEWKHWTDAGEELKAPQVWKRRLREREARVRSGRQGPEAVRAREGVGARHHGGRCARPQPRPHGVPRLIRATASCWSPRIRSIIQILIRNPEWSLWADMDPAMAITARKRLLDMAATDKIQIAAYHLPFPSTGFISKRGDGYEFHPAYWQPVL